MIDTACQESWYVAGTLRYSHNLDGLALGSVDDQIRPYRPEQNRERCKVFAGVAPCRVYVPALLKL